MKQKNVIERQHAVKEVISNNRFILRKTKYC